MHVSVEQRMLHPFCLSLGQHALIQKLRLGLTGAPVRAPGSWLQVGPSRLYGATCEKMLKIRDGPGVRDPPEARKSRFSGRKPSGTRATT